MANSPYVGPDEPLQYQPDLTSRSWEIDPSLSTLLARKRRPLQLPLVHWVLWVSVWKHSILQSQGCYNHPGSIIWLSASHKSFWTLRRYFVLKFSNGQLSPKSALTDQNFEIIYLLNGCSNWACKHIPKMLAKSSMGQYMGMGGLIVPKWLINLC